MSGASGWAGVMAVDPTSSGLKALRARYTKRCPEPAVPPEFPGDLAECETCEGIGEAECGCPGVGPGSGDVCGACGGEGSYSCPDCQ